MKKFRFDVISKKLFTGKFFTIEFFDLKKNLEKADFASSINSSLKTLFHGGRTFVALSILCWIILRLNNGSPVNSPLTIHHGAIHCRNNSPKIEGKFNLEHVFSPKKKSPQRIHHNQFTANYSPPSIHHRAFTADKITSKNSPQITNSGSF
jgi:hypothetical protein